MSGSPSGATVSALRFLFGVTLDRPDLSRKLASAPRRRKLPDVLSVDEVARLLEAAPGIKGVAYGAGLRVSEVAHLKSDDIDSKRILSGSFVEHRPLDVFLQFVDERRPRLASITSQLWLHLSEHTPATWIYGSPYKGRSGLTEALDRGDDLVGRLCPSFGFRVSVVPLDGETDVLREMAA